jgi:hypothetical protein
MGLETISIRYASLPQQHQLWAAGPACQNQAEKRVFLQKLISKESKPEGRGFYKPLQGAIIKDNLESAK